MKNKLKISVIGLLIFGGIGYVQGQVKIGHINAQSIFTQMPEYKRMADQIQTLSKKYEDEIKKMSTELETKYKKYESESGTVSQEINKQRGEELQKLQQEIQKKQVDASQALQKKESELSKPIFEKAQKAINEVGKANGYDFILDSKALLYEGKNSNVLDLVKSKLGI